MSKILVVDDQKGIQQMLKVLFEIEGYKTVFANNGHEAVNIVKKDMPDLVVMDVRMPLMNGVEALKEIRKININLPVIMMTAYAENNQKSKAKELGVYKWLYKPLDIDFLKKTIKEALS